MLFLLSITQGYAQLGFCSGSKGDPIFFEDFGSGVTDGPELSSEQTTYTFTDGTPNDGSYTISSSTQYYDWHDLPDHTPGDVNGKSLVVNASYTPGEFYTRKISGLCSTSTYEFSAWLVNLLPVTACGGTGIPVNVSFEIWDETETSLLRSGSTGNLFAQTNPGWEQYGLVFETLPNQESVILKMRNNAPGGCGNDLAIDDIAFAFCSDLPAEIRVAGTGENSYSTCQEDLPAAIQLEINDDAISRNLYFLWQKSDDNVNWVDLEQNTSGKFETSAIYESTYYRVKIAESKAGLNDNLCSSVSSSFYLQISEEIEPPRSEGNQQVCAGEELPQLRVQSRYAVNWYDAMEGGNLISENALNYQPTSAGTYYAEAYDAEIGCRSRTRTPISLSVEEDLDSQTIYLSKCENESLLLNAGNASLYNWSTGETTRTIEVTIPGTYDVFYAEIDECPKQIIFEVEDVSQAEISEIRFDGFSVEIMSEETSGYEYSLDGVNFQQSNRFNVGDISEITAYMRDLKACFTTTKLLYLGLRFPEIFTPNNDGFNDVLKLEGADSYTILQVMIFDRYGKLLKFGNSKYFQWDGTFNGKTMPSDDYWYRILTKDKGSFTGHFSLKRDQNR